MKIGQFFQKMVGGSMILATLAAPVFTSCYDDAPLWDKVEDLDSRLTALEAKLNTDLAALQTLLESQINALAGNVEDLAGKVGALVTVKNCKEQADGSYVITLSDGTEFTVYPKYKENHTGLVTTTEINGVLYWALIDNDGKAVVVTDADKNPIPVIDVVPQVKVDAETAVVSISFDGGKTWIEIGTDTPYIFADAEIVTTDYYTEEEEAEDPEYCVEEPMYVVLTLADGNTITVTIDGAANFMFGNPYLGGITKVQYVAAGDKTSISLSATNIEGWVKEVPAGWKIVEDLQYLDEYGQAEFHVTAPSTEAIKSGAAVAEGDLKVVAVAVGGKTITASVKLTTVPFKGVSAGKGVINVEMNNGLGGYLLGVSSVDTYDAEAIVAELKSVVEAYEEFENWQGEIMKEYTWSPWYTDENDTAYDDNYQDGSVEGYPVDDLVLETELVEGEQYVVWAVAVNMWYDNATGAQGYTVGDIVSTDYLNATITLDETATVVKFNDIQIAAEFVGVTAFYGGFEAQYAGMPTTPEDVVMNINEGFNYGYAPDAIYVEDMMEEGVYTGNPNDLVMGTQEIEPSKDYYLYLIPVVEGKTKYTENDVYWYEFTTPAVVPGGSVKVVPGDPVLDYKKVSVPLSAEGAVYMYYKFVETEMLSTIEDKTEYLLEKGVMKKGAAATVSQANLLPAQTITLIAMAVDKDGKYGEVFQKDYTTKAMEYASAVVKAEIQGTPAQTGTVKVSCDAADVAEYYYWYGEKENGNWTNKSYFGGSADNASAFIALNPNFYFIKKVAAADLPAEGIELEDLTVGAPSVFVIAAKIGDKFTKATVVEFTPSLDLGTIVYATDDNGVENPVWAAAKPKVNAKVESIGDFAHVSWTIDDLPEGFKGVTAIVHKDYLMDYPSVKNKIEFFLTYEYMDKFEIVSGETYSAQASGGYNIYTVICDAEGNYYETYVEELNIKGGFGI